MQALLAGWGRGSHSKHQGTPKVVEHEKAVTTGVLSEQQAATCEGEDWGLDREKTGQACNFLNRNTGVSVNCGLNNTALKKKTINSSAH